MTNLLKLLNEIRPEGDFRGSTDFLRDGLLDSFDIVTLVSSLDKAFGISIEGTQIIPENFQTIEAIRSLLRKHGVEVA